MQKIPVKYFRNDMKKLPKSLKKLVGQAQIFDRINSSNYTVRVKRAYTVTEIRTPVLFY